MTSQPVILAGRRESRRGEAAIIRSSATPNGLITGLPGTSRAMTTLICHSRRQAEKIAEIP
ncbi:hypothetical protein [Candidatus Spongiihabitans sp.]|uniref:hypothetical protein n=1 Tax=Candidatus Spongiihabitans sp. TaxID=3101308 RepID=UPI003C7CD00E